MKISKKVYAEDLIQGDDLYEGEIIKIVDNYENVECIDVYVSGEDDPLTYRLDDRVEIILDVA